jgi:hypothetical protein
LILNTINKIDDSHKKNHCKKNFKAFGNEIVSIILIIEEFFSSISIKFSCFLTITSKKEDKDLFLESKSGQYTRMFDNFGTEYSVSRFEFSDGDGGKTLILGIPMAARAIFENVSTQATHITVLEIAVDADYSGYGSYWRFKFRNIPFSNSPSTPSTTSSTPEPIPTCIGNECGEVWSLAPEPSDTQGYTPIDRFRSDDGNLWKNPLRFQALGGFPNSFAPAPYKNAIEGFFQIRYACEASWYSGAKDLPWIPANVVGAIEYCVYPDNIPEVVNHLRTTADKLACEGGMEVCE